MFRRARGNYRGIPPIKSGGAGPPPPIIPAQWKDLFPGAFLVGQTDFGLTYGSVMKPTAGNSSATIVQISGAIAGVPVPVWVKATNSLGVGTGGTFDVYFDGLGVTPAIVGLLPVGGATIALTGAGAGLGLTWTANTSVANDTWKATCAALADQSGNGFHYSQPVSGRQPIVTAGLNGKPGLLFDGGDDYLQATIVGLALPYQPIIVARHLNPTTPSAPLIGTANGSAGVLYTGGAGSVILAYAGSFGSSVPFTSTAPTRFSYTFTNSAADTVRAGAASNSGTSAFSNVDANVAIGGNLGFAQFGNIEVFAVIYTPPTSLAAFDAALNTPQGYGPGAIAV